MLNLSDADGERMQAIENHIARSVLQFKHNTEAGLVVFALVRVARTLLNQYPDGPRVKLARLLCDFLEGRTDPRDGDRAMSIFTH